MICLYCQFLSRSVTPQTIRNYLSGVKLLHLIGGYEFNLLDTYELRLTLRGVTRLAQHTPSRAPPITPDILHKLVNVCDSHQEEEVTAVCACLFTFFLMARMSNVVPDSARLFDTTKHLCRGDIFPAEGGLLVLFKWTKTIQSYERRLFIPLVEKPGSSPVCPVDWFHRMCALVPACDQSPAFIVRKSPSSNYKPLTKGVLVTFVRAKLRLAGVPFPHLYSGHSFRRGAASFAFQCGVPGEIIQVFGDWASDAYKGYLEFSLSAKLQLAHKMSHRLIEFK